MRPTRQQSHASAAAHVAGRVCAFLAGAFFAAPGFAEPLDVLAPCLTARASTQAYADTFLSKGWIVAEGELRDRVAEASGEIDFTLRTMAGAFRDRAEVLKFLERAHAQGARMAEAPTAVLLVRDDRNLLIDLAMAGRKSMRLTCVMTGADLAEVRETAPGEPRKLGKREMAFSLAEVVLPVTPLGLEKVRVDMIRLFFPFLTRAMATGGDAVHLTATFSADAAPDRE